MSTNEHKCMFSKKDYTKFVYFDIISHTHRTYSLKNFNRYKITFITNFLVESMHIMSGRHNMAQSNNFWCGCCAQNRNRCRRHSLCGIKGCLDQIQITTHRSSKVNITPNQGTKQPFFLSIFIFFFKEQIFYPACFSCFRQNPSEFLICFHFFKGNTMFVHIWFWFSRNYKKRSFIYWKLEFI